MRRRFGAASEGSNLVTLTGPLRQVGLMLTDALLLEYAEGMPMAQVGWGRLSTPGSDRAAFGPFPVLRSHAENALLRSGAGLESARAICGRPSIRRSAGCAGAGALGTARRKSCW